MKKILLLMPEGAAARNVISCLSDYGVTHVTTAADAIGAKESFDAVILELSLARHSGFEFIHEFRSYADWRDIPIIIYSRILLDEAVLRARSFRAMNVRYAYQPEVSLAELSIILQKELGS